MESSMMSYTNGNLGFWLRVTVVLMLWGCSSADSDKNDDGLDISLKKLPAQEKSDGKNGEKSESSGLTIPTNTVIDWQQFFKPAPNREQRAALEKQLEAP